MVHRHRGAEAHGGLELGVGTAGDDGARAKMDGDLQRRHPDPAADAPDQHRLRRPELRSGRQHPPGRQGRQREGRGLRPRHPFRHAGEVGRGHDHQLGRGAREMLAQDREVRAERLFAFPARRAGAAGEARIDQHPIARPPSSGRGSHRVHFTGAVGADHVRKGWLRVGKPARHPEIQPIQRRAPDPDQDIVRARGWWEAERPGPRAGPARRCPLERRALE